jgi:hypothetical protein
VPKIARFSRVVKFVPHFRNRRAAREPSPMFLFHLQHKFYVRNLKSASASGEKVPRPSPPPSGKGLAQTSLCVDILEEILVCVVY